MSTRRAVAKVEKEGRQKAADKQKLKDAGAGIYRIGLAKSLHGLIEAGFFRKPHTSKEAFLKLNPNIIPTQLSAADRKAIARITGTLTRERFLLLLDKLAPLPGSTAVRFVEKAADKAETPRSAIRP